MQTGKCLLLLLLLPLIAVAAPPQSTVIGSGIRRQLLLVSLDGFRHDYLTKFSDDSKFLRRMASEGVHVQSMTTEFTTKTFPNHWSIVTGRHQESHGIISNSMYDPQFNASFSMSTQEERWWNESLPIWVTAKRQGLKTATFFWPGSEVQFSGTRPDYYFVYNGSMTYEYRVETVVRWLTEENMDLCTLYFNEPDSAGHRYGPDSSEVGSVIRRLDFLLELLVIRLEKSGYMNKVDIIITSDHGMTALDNSKVIHFNNALDPYVDRYMDSGPLLSMFAKEGMKDQLVEYLQNETQSKNLAIRVFTRETLPESYHYSNHRRIPDVIVMPNPGYTAFRRSTNVNGGNHGFDNTYDEMKVPFIGFGPSFKRGAVVSGFRQVDIYGLMCHLLRITPQPNNGSLALLPQMLSSSAGVAASQSLTVSLILVIAGLMVRGGS